MSYVHKWRVSIQFPYPPNPNHTHNRRPVRVTYQLVIFKGRMNNRMASYVSSITALPTCLSTLSIDVMDRKLWRRFYKEETFLSVVFRDNKKIAFQGTRKIRVYECNHERLALGRNFGESNSFKNIQSTGKRWATLRNSYKSIFLGDKKSVNKHGCGAKTMKGEDKGGSQLLRRAEGRSETYSSGTSPFLRWCWRNQTDACRRFLKCTHQSEAVGSLKELVTVKNWRNSWLNQTF